jgi:hypothetical protein
MRESLWRRLARLELDRHAHESAWRVPMPPGLSPAGVELWHEMQAELADPTLDDHSRQVKYTALSALNAELVGIMCKVRGRA